jgi:hypothetical protein
MVDRCGKVLTPTSSSPLGSLDKDGQFLKVKTEVYSRVGARTGSKVHDQNENVKTEQVARGGEPHSPPGGGSSPAVILRCIKVPPGCMHASQGVRFVKTDVMPKTVQDYFREEHSDEQDKFGGKGALEAENVLWKVENGAQKGALEGIKKSLTVGIKYFREEHSDEQDKFGGKGALEAEKVLWKVENGAQKGALEAEKVPMDPDTTCMDDSMLLAVPIVPELYPEFTMQYDTDRDTDTNAACEGLFGDDIIATPHVLCSFMNMTVEMMMLDVIGCTNTSRVEGHDDADHDRGQRHAAFAPAKDDAA